MLIIIIKLKKYLLKIINYSLKLVFQSKNINIKMPRLRRIKERIEKGYYKPTPLHMAVIFEKEDEVEHLAHKDTVNVKTEDGKTPLHYAAMTDNTKILEFLIKSGADVDAKDEQDNIAVHCAADYNSSEAIKKLAKYESMLSYSRSDSMTPIHVAVENDNSDVVDTLITLGAYFNEVNNEWCTPLILAIKLGRIKSMEVFFRRIKKWIKKTT